MKRLFLPVFITLSFYSYSQDSALIYAKVIIIDSTDKSDIYDRALLWCSKSFNESKAAINVKEKESGIVAGKASITNIYKVPGKKDSIASWVFSDYVFDWAIEVKDGKARFTAKNVAYHDDSGNHPVYINSKPPNKVMFQKPEKTQIEWDMSKKYFIVYMDGLAESLKADLTHKDNW
ncbi:MAG TPA: DUF4468 domain-containing protein [Mucilaginibacter sp.]